MPAKTERLEIGFDPEGRARVERAAAMAGQSVADFVADAALAAADQVLSAERTVVSPAFFERLLAELDRDPEPVTELVEAIEQVRERPLLDNSLGRR